MLERMNSSANPSSRLLSVAVMGAGSVGCYFGALLARAGHSVTLIGRASHMQAINEHGLPELLTYPGFALTEEAE